MANSNISGTYRALIIIAIIIVIIYIAKWVVDKPVIDDESKDIEKITTKSSKTSNNDNQQNLEDPKFDIFREIFDSIDDDANIHDMEQKYETLGSRSKSTPKYKFIDDNTSGYATSAVAQYMQKQLDATEGLRASTPSGFNQLGAVRPTTALGEIIEMPKLYTEFNLNENLVEDTTDEYSEKFLQYKPMVNNKAKNTTYANMQLRKISSSTQSR